MGRRPSFRDGTLRPTNKTNVSNATQICLGCPSPSNAIGSRESVKSAQSVDVIVCFVPVAARQRLTGLLGPVVIAAGLISSHPALPKSTIITNNFRKV
jgi:hypothetical protein